MSRYSYERAFVSARLLLQNLMNAKRPRNSLDIQRHRYDKKKRRRMDTTESFGKPVVLGTAYVTFPFIKAINPDIKQQVSSLSKSDEALYSLMTYCVSCDKKEVTEGTMAIQLVYGTHGSDRIVRYTPRVMCTDCARKTDLQGGASHGYVKNCFTHQFLRHCSSVINKAIAETKLQGHDEDSSSYIIRVIDSLKSEFSQQCIYIILPEDGSDKCRFCKKPSVITCGRCNAVSYCSLKCKSKSEPWHKTSCHNWKTDTMHHTVVVSKDGTKRVIE